MMFQSFSPHSLIRPLACFVLFGLFSCRPPSSSPTRPIPITDKSSSPSKPPLPAKPGSPPTNKSSPTDASANPDPIGDVLSADLTPGETTTRLLSLLPTTPADDKSFLVQIAGNYCPDEEYWRILPLLLDRSQPEDVRDELIRDVLRRPDNVRLRPLYRLALDSSHPLSNEAREYLFAYLQDVPEKDFGALGKAVEKSERENR